MNYELLSPCGTVGWNSATKYTR